MLEAAKRAAAILKAAGAEFLADEIPRSAAALTYYSAFSIVPLLFVAVAVAGFLLDDPGAVERAVDQVSEFTGSEVGDTIESILHRVRSQRGGALSIGLVLAAFSASSIFQQVQSVLGVIFHVPRPRRRTGAFGWLVKRSIGVGSALVLAVLSLTPVAAVGAVEWLVDLLPDSLDGLDPTLRLGIPLVSVAMLMVIVGLSFQALTSVEIPWRAAIRGGATTALMGLTAAALAGAYLARVGSTGTLGALGGVAVLLLFFYVMWIVYLFGAEVTKVYGDYIEFGDVRRPVERSEVAPISEAAATRDIASPREQSASSPGPPDRRGSAQFAIGLLIGWLMAGRNRRR